MATLMVSISGIRGIIGDGLDPTSLVKYTSAYSDFAGEGKIVVGSDGRISGGMVKHIVIGTLLAKGNDVIDIGVCPTPTVLLNVKKLGAAGGIQISASHNPNEWNALKLLNSEGEFMTPEQNRGMLENLERSTLKYRAWNGLGKYMMFKDALKNHINEILKMKYIDVELIRSKRFKVLLDCVNAAGSYIMPELLREFGCEVIEYNCEKTGVFPRPPEPIPENLTETFNAVKTNQADVGIVVDPDVDRLVIITEKGEPFGEENTIAQAVRFVLSKEKGNAVVNLSTTRAVDDIAAEFDSKVFRSAVGEANVVEKMKEIGAVIGGEGSGGVIYPAVHYGRDALVGTAILLQQLAESGMTVSKLKAGIPSYFISKKKIEIEGREPDAVLNSLKERYSDCEINTDDGLRIDFEDHWVHFRKSNTEPIVRCIAEARTAEEAEKLTLKYFGEVKELLG